MKKGCSRIACMILAAGMATRFGSVKQLARIRGKPLLQRSLDAANSSLSDYVMLIVGSNSSEILSKINLGRAQVVFNNNFLRGQSTSIKCGITNLPADSAGVIIMVADQPFVKSIHLDKIIRIFKSGKLSEVVALSHDGQPRNPVLIPKRLFPKLVKLRGDVGARSIIRGYSRLRLVEISDEKVFLDVDTRSAVSELNRSNRK
jgi:molybdenum cofactor cytidylyltransferase